jgi:two-component system cell cycle response regulator
VSDLNPEIIPRGEMPSLKIARTNILIAEDDLVSRRVLEAFLVRWGYGVTQVSTGDDAWRILNEEGAPRLAILDWMMPGLNGVELCARVRARTGMPYVYVLLLSSRNEKKDKLEGLQAGADDYLTKPFDAEELQARLFVGERILRLQDQLLSGRDALQFQATHDPLTGLANRGEILSLVTRELSRSERTQASTGVIMCDIDHFKQVNDSYGHLTGDAILRGVASQLNALLRPYDSIGRYGGEEFVVLAPLSDVNGTLGVAERIRTGIESAKFETPAGELRMTMSLGVAVREHGHSPGTEDMLQAADAALYRAKAAGRNRVEVATPLDFEILALAGGSAAGRHNP